MSGLGGFSLVVINPRVVDVALRRLAPLRCLFDGVALW